MGRPKKNANPPEDPDGLNVFAEENPDDELLADFLESVGTYSEVKVYRMPQRGQGVGRLGHAPSLPGKEHYIDTLSPGELSEEIIRDNYGPGAYVLKFIRDGKYWRQRRVFIGEKRIDNGNGTMAASTPAQDHIQFMREQMVNQQNLIIALIGAQKGPDTGALLQGLAAFAKPPDSSAMLAAVVTAFAQLKGSVGAEEDKLKMVKDIVGIAKELIPGGGDGDSWVGVAKEVGGKVVEAFMTAKGSVAPTAGVHVPLPAEPPNGVLNPSPADLDKPRSQDELMGDWIRAELAFLKKKATADKDPQAWAEYLVDNSEEPGCAAMLVALREGATFDHLCQFDTEIASNPTYALWFKKLYDFLATELRETVDRSGAGGDTANPGTNAPVGDRWSPHG